jgi:hypothetical protein
MNPLSDEGLKLELEQAKHHKLFFAKEKFLLGYEIERLHTIQKKLMKIIKQ